MAPSIEDEEKAAAHLTKVNSIRQKIGLPPLSKIGVAAPLQFTTSISSKKRCSFELRRRYLEGSDDDEPPPPPGSWMSLFNSTSSPTMLADLNRRDHCGSGGQRGMERDGVRRSKGQGQGGGQTGTRRAGEGRGGGRYSFGGQVKSAGGIGGGQGRGDDLTAAGGRVANLTESNVCYCFQILFSLFPGYYKLFHQAH